MANAVIDDMNDPEFRKLLAQEELILEVTETICELLENEKISRKELADRLGKTKGFVSQLLNGGRNLTLRTVADILHVLGYKIALTPYKEASQDKNALPDRMPNKPEALPAKIIPENQSRLISEDQPLAPLTTWRIGGAAARLAAPADMEDVWGLMRLACDRGWPLFFLGRGSNVLIDDAGLPGLTLHLAKSLQNLEHYGDTLRAGAGVSLPRLAQAALKLGFAGYEFLAGIPGTVGAGVRLNVGADGASLAGVLKRVWVATPQLQLLEFTPAELGLGYRSSLLLNFPHWLVVEAEFNLAHPAAPEAIQARMAALIAQRKTRQPANPRSCGSVFKNPAAGPAAGRLIEAAGFKGHRLGDAVVSRKHANFILNAGSATAAQVKALMAEIQEKVWRTQGVALEREVVLLPEDLA
jgi:UDP-N-acetylmuramate dehydrogenase